MTEEKKIYYEQTQEQPPLESRVQEEERKNLFRTYEFVYYILWAVEILLLFRFVFRLLGASQASGFVQFLYAITWPLVAPFFGIFGIPRVGEAAFETMTLVAMAVYAVLVYAIIKLMRIITATKEEHVEA